MALHFVFQGEVEGTSVQVASIIVPALEVVFTGLIEFSLLLADFALVAKQASVAVFMLCTHFKLFESDANVALTFLGSAIEEVLTSVSGQVVFLDQEFLTSHWLLVFCLQNWTIFVIRILAGLQIDVFLVLIIYLGAYVGWKRIHCTGVSLRLAKRVALGSDKIE